MLILKIPLCSSFVGTRLAAVTLHVIADLTILFIQNLSNKDVRTVY